MKRCEELGISPTPWQSSIRPIQAIRDANGDVVCETSIVSVEDMRLIAAAPKMYDALYDAVTDACHCCKYAEYDGWKCTNEDRDCYVQKWRAILAEAAGS